MLFRELAEYYERLEAVSSRLKMIEVLSEAFKILSPKELQEAVYITQGILLPPFEGVELGVAEKLVEEGIAISTGYKKDEVEKEYKRSGDMGLAVQAIKSKTKLKRLDSKKYTISETYERVGKIAETGGEGSKERKIGMIADMIGSATPTEAKYTVRYILGQLRLGVGDSTIMEALSVIGTGDRKFKEEIERAYNICSDLGLVARELAEKGPKAIAGFKVTLFKPVRPALAERLPTAEQILERMHGIAAVEQKYDGFRVQVHKDGNTVRLFSRRLEDTTDMFPDIAKAVKEEVGAKRIIFEGEALAYNESTSEYLPFQETIQRKRKHDIAKKAEELPLHLFAFDILYLDNKDMLSEPYEKRREMIESLFKNDHMITPTTKIVTRSPKELELFFEKSVENGLEGIMAKDLKAP